MQRVNLEETPQKSELEQQLDAIVAQVSTVCCYGEGNKSQTKQASNLLLKLLAFIIKLRSRVLVSEKDLVQAKVPEEERIKYMQGSQVLKESFENYYGLKLDEWDKYFRPHPGMPGKCYANPAVLLRLIPALTKSAHLMQDINEDFKAIADTLKALTEVQLSDFQKIVAFLTYEWSKNVKNNALFFKGRDEEIKVGTKHSVTGASEPKKTHTRTLLIQYMARDLMFGPCLYANGNCQAMAELAFLLAVQKISDQKITYVRFHDSKGKFEELNAIIVGNYPAPGGLISAPWYSKSLWKWVGSLQETPYISHYDTVSVMYTVDNSAEQKRVQKILADLNFDIPTLLAKPDRINFTSYIERTAEKIHGFLTEKNLQKVDAPTIK